MKNITFVILTAMILTSCMDEVELKMEKFEPMVVLDGEINDQDEKQFLRISLSQPYFQEGEKVNISNALVTLYEDGVAVGIYTNSNPGVYEIDLKGKIGKEYRLSVLLPEIPPHPEFSGKEIISESELLAPVSEIKDINGLFRKESLIYDEGYYVSIDTYDPKGKGNYYRWTMDVNGVVPNDPKQIMVLDDERIDGNPILDLDLTFEPFNVGDIVVVRQKSISKDFYQYLMDIYMQALTQESFFDSPSYNPLSNLKSDISVVGYFNASAYTEATLLIEGE